MTAFTLWNGGEDGITELEKELIALLGEAELKEIGEQLAEIVRQHNLQKSPDICGKLFHYLSNVIVGWNSV